MEDNNDNNKVNNKEDEFISDSALIIEEHVTSSEGRVTIRKYERGKFLGRGGFAKCYELKSLDTNKTYAAKIFDKINLTNSRSKKKLINEIKLHKKLHHQNIVNFEHFFEDKEHVYILLELCANQSLNDLLKRRKRITEIEVQCYLIQLLKALKYIHSHKIIHRDLKLGNCFLTSKLELKLGDFGLAAKLEYEGQRRRTLCGTPNYIAPEILEKKNGHSFEVDIWSLGIIIYTLLFGRPPFETNDVKLTYKKIKINNYTFPENIKVNYHAKRLISVILNLDPAKRPSIDQILEHDFFKTFNSVPLLLPTSTLACPPGKKYITQFMQKDNSVNYFSGFKNNNFNTNLNDMKSINNHISQNLNEEYDDETKNNDEFFNDEKLFKIEDDTNTLLESHNKSANLSNKLDNMFNKSLNKIEFLKVIPKVEKYFDFSSKFGVIYIIKNTCVGICFNDFSNIIKSFNLKKQEISKFIFVYLEKSSKTQLNFDENGFEGFINNKSNPIDLIKKFEIFKHVLIKYEKDIRVVVRSNDLISTISRKGMTSNYKLNEICKIVNNIIFMKQFLKTQNSIIFRLSNKILQVIFSDKCEVIFFTDGSDYIYKNEKGEETYLNILSVLNSEDGEMIKRVKMAKNLLITFVKNHKIKKKMT